MQSFDDRRIFDLDRRNIQIGTILGAELDNISKQNKLIVLDFKTNGNYCFSGFRHC